MPNVPIISKNIVVLKEGSSLDLGGLDVGSKVGIEEIEPIGLT